MDSGSFGDRWVQAIFSNQGSCLVKNVGNRRVFLAQLGIPVKSWAVPGHFQEGARGAA